MCMHILLLQMIQLSALTLCMLGNIACFLSSADIFQKKYFQNILSKIPSVSKVWIQIWLDENRPDVGPNFL